MLRTLCLLVFLTASCQSVLAGKATSTEKTSPSQKTSPAKAAPVEQTKEKTTTVEKTVDALKAKARAGDAIAQFELASRYVKGQGVPQDDKAAANWYRKAAEQGDPYAQYNLGVLYFKGKGVAQDYSQAAAWYDKAARQDNPDARNALAGMYYEGQGVTQDFSQAAALYTHAARQGHKDAQSSLAHLYYEGQGVTQDNRQAYFWIFIAAAGSAPDSDAARNRDMVAGELSPQTRQTTQQEAAAFLEKLATASPGTPPPAQAIPAPTAPAPASVAQLKAPKPPAAVSPTPDKKTGLKGAASESWAVQVAALSTQTKANTLIKQLQTKGFKAFSVVRQSSKDSAVRVLIGPLPDKTAASKTQRSVDKAMGLKSMVVPFHTS